MIARLFAAVSMVAGLSGKTAASFCTAIGPVSVLHGNPPGSTSTASGGVFPLINAWTAQHEIDACAAAYERMGWVRQ